MIASQSSDLSYTDLSRMMTCGRRYAATKVVGYLKEAAEYLYLTVTDFERQQLLFWWDEGTRNIAQDTDENDQYRKALQDEWEALAREEGQV